MIDEEERDNEVAQQVIDLTQSNDRDELVSLGSFDIRVVGIRFYTGVTTTGEQVLLLREPNNQYDRNAIRVCNVARQQVGHLPRGAAATLSPLIDNRQIQLEGTVTGPKEVYEMPMRVDVYATAPQASHEQIYNTLRRGGIRLENSPFALAMQSQSANKRKAEINAAAAAAAAKRYRGMSTLATSSSGSQPRGIDVMAPFEITGYNYLGGPPLGMGGRAPHYPLPHWPGYVQPQIPQPNLKDLVEDAQRFNPRELGSIIEKFGMGEEVLEKMPLAKQPNRLSITLLPYQLQGLQWLLDHESPKLPTKPNDVVQFWKPTTRGQYINITTKFVLPNPSLASGGILADDMGLGKTVQMISLIIADVEKNGPRAPSCGGTLIVAPLSVMSNWKDQISRHVKSEEPLVISIFHGAGKNAKVDIKSCDVVITSYGTLTSEFENFQTSKKSPIFGLKWRRIILDEAHQIRNPKAKASLASAALEAQSRWALTGTPIVNNLKDLYSLVRYLRFSGGLSEIDIFNRVFMRPLNTGDKEGSERLQALMATICLRRTKEMKFVNLGLPELKEYVHRVKFSKEERDKYDVLKAEAEGLLERYVKGKASRMNQQAAGSTHALQSQASGSTEPANNDYRCLLEYLLRMRQMCNHAMLCGADRVKAIEERLAEIAENGLSEEARSLLQEVLQLAIDSQEDCAICLETLHNPRITVCRHVFGEECIARVIEEQHKCPMCRHDLPDNTSSTLIQPYVELKPWVPQSLEDGTAVPAPSSKIEALIAILKATRTSDPTSKTIVFSQWTKYLDLISPHLNLAGLRFCRIDGSMRVNQRDAAIARLSLPEDDPEAVDVMLASLGVASVGLNLVAANQVILADSWWAPAIEDQAVDRVHRLGQKRETTVWRLVVEDSIEEKVLKIQEAKRELVGRAFKEEEDADAASSSTSGKKKTRRGKGRETRLADLQMLLSRTPAQNHN
ncbi:SNF2 family helicase [Peziza echinospora]|nr:SNF2 family helicase [Peziza echinospora]